MPKNRFDLNRACRPQPLPLRAGQIFACFPTVFQQAEGDADLAVAPGSGALASQRAFGTVEAFVNMPLALVAVVAGVA